MELYYLQTKYFLKDHDLISFPPYVGESYIEEGSWQEPFGEVGNRPGIMGFPTAPPISPGKRLFVVPETHAPPVMANCAESVPARLKEIALEVAMPTFETVKVRSAELPPANRTVPLSLGSPGSKAATNTLVGTLNPKP